MADVYTVVTCPYTRPSLIWLSSIEVQHSSDLCILHIIYKRVRSTVTSTQHKFNICMIACERVTKPFMFLFLSGFFVFFAGFIQVLENLESPGILLWHFPGPESPGKRLLILESSGNLLNSSKKYETYGRQ